MWGREGTCALGVRGSFVLGAYLVPPSDRRLGLAIAVTVPHESEKRYNRGTVAIRSCNRKPEFL
jgi:hypothetical protein